MDAACNYFGLSFKLCHLIDKLPISVNVHVQSMMLYNLVKGAAKMIPKHLLDSYLAVTLV